MSTISRGPAPPPLDPESVRAVALIRPRFLGDVCLTLPTLDAVRRASPRARIAYLVEPESAPLLEADPRIDELIVARRSQSPADWLSTLRRIQRFGPDVVLDLFCNPRTALWTLFSGARVRVGTRGKGWRSRAYTHQVRPRTLSAIGFHLAWVSALGWDAPYSVPGLRIRPEARDEAATALRKAGAGEDSVLVGFHPGARWPTRRWAPERWSELAGRFLAAEPSGFALVTGSGEERSLVESVRGTLPGARSAAVVGWPIARLVAAQSLCAAFASGDTGPLHTAVAAGTPTLGLFSRNQPATFFPYPESAGHRIHYARVECSPCDRDECEDLRCLHRLSVEGAWRLLSSMLSARRRAAS